MKLLGTDFSGTAVVKKIEERLKGRSVLEGQAHPVELHAPEARVDPREFHLRGLVAHADPTQELPRQTHRSGVGRVVLLAKWGFRKGCQVFINEALGRQRLFNGHVRDAYAELSAEVEALRAEVKALKAARREPRR